MLTVLSKPLSIRSRIIPAGFLILAIFGLCSGGNAAAVTTDTMSLPVVAVMPPAAYAGQPAVERLLPLLEAQLAQERITLVTAAQLRETLRLFRIRSAGMVTKEEAAQITSARKVDFLVLGSVDLYSEEPFPEAAFTLRLLRTSDMRIIWAVTVAGNGEDYSGILGLGRITSMEVLAPKLVEEALKGFAGALAGNRIAADDSLPEATVALVTFDNLTAAHYAGEIFTAVLLSELTARGVHVVEPGMVTEVFMRNNRLASGQIDDSLLRQLHDSLGVDLVITGTVDRFQASSGGEGSGADIAVGARCLDAAAGKIVTTYEGSREGAGSQLLFNSGGLHSLGKLAQQMARDMIPKLISKKD